MTAAEAARRWEAATRPEDLLDTLQRATPEYLMRLSPHIRRFACWCARDAGATSACVVSHRVLHNAERHANGELPAGLLEAERRSVSGLVAGARAIGLRQRHPLAALRLAAISTADEDAFVAAREAARFSVMAAVLREGEAAGIVTRLRQASALRFFIPNPFIRDGEATHGI